MEEKNTPVPTANSVNGVPIYAVQPVLGTAGRAKKLSMAEQIELYEKVNREYAEKKEREASACTSCRCKIRPFPGETAFGISYP